jgi:hypothetical protein
VSGPGAEAEGLCAQTAKAEKSKTNETVVRLLILTGILALYLHDHRGKLMCHRPSFSSFCLTLISFVAAQKSAAPDNVLDEAHDRADHRLKIKEGPSDGWKNGRKDK